MTAREELAAVLRLKGLTPREVDALLDAHRAAVLREAADAINAMPQDYECDPGRGDAADLLRRMADAAAPAGAEDGDRRA